MSDAKQTYLFQGVATDTLCRSLKMLVITIAEIARCVEMHFIASGASSVAKAAQLADRE